MSIGYPWADLDSGDHDKAFESKEEWDSQPVPATKLQTLINIIHNVSQHVRQPPATVSDDGDLLWEAVPTDVQAGDDRPVKIIVYSEFPKYQNGLTSVSFPCNRCSLSDLIFSQALRVNGINALAINGGVTAVERERRIAQWSNLKSDVSVLIISLVGSTGLNLTAGTVIIHQVCFSGILMSLLRFANLQQDIVWSDVLRDQIDGRLHRRGQELPVTSYRILARGTTDIMMSGMATAKSEMLQGFMGKPSGRFIFQVFTVQAWLTLSM